MWQDEDENEPEDEFFRSFRIKTVTNEPGPQYYDTLKDRFVRHAQVPEQTKALVFVFVFVFVLAHEQAIRYLFLSSSVKEDSKRNYVPQRPIDRLFYSLKIFIHEHTHFCLQQIATWGKLACYFFFNVISQGIEVSFHGKLWASSSQ